MTVKRRKKKASWPLRLGGLLLLVFLGAVLLHGPVQVKRLEKDSRRLLLDVQRALQSYHVAKEQYPAESMSGVALIRMLRESKHLAEVPWNPWERGLYDPEGGAEQEDWLVYRTDRLAETYELVIFRPYTEEVLFRLDSVENQSLDE